MWQTVLQEAGRVWLVSSWITALAFLIWIKADNKIQLPKGKFILILISLSITHAILKTTVPQIAFVFMILLFTLISVASYKLTILNALKSILKLIAIMFVSETFLYILVFKVLGIQGNPDGNIILITSGVLNLLLALIIKRKELFENGIPFLWRTSSKHQEARKTGNC